MSTFDSPYACSECGGRDHKPWHCPELCAPLYQTGLQTNGVPRGGGGEEDDSASSYGAPGVAKARTYGEVAASRAISSTNAFPTECASDRPVWAATWWMRMECCGDSPDCEGSKDSKDSPVQSS